VSVPVQELLAEGRAALRAGDARAHVARWSASAPERSPAM
jgi:hypothetical protein